jgi:hypothetical protein
LDHAILELPFALHQPSSANVVIDIGDGERREDQATGVV